MVHTLDNFIPQLDFWKLIKCDGVAFIMPCDGIAFIKPVFPPILLTIVFFNNASKIICDLFQLGSSKAQDCSTTGDKLPVCPGKESINRINVLCTIYKMQNSRSVSQSGYIHA